MGSIRFPGKKQKQKTPQNDDVLLFQRINLICFVKKNAPQGVLHRLDALTSLELQEEALMVMVICLTLQVRRLPFYTESEKEMMISNI